MRQDTALPACTPHEHDTHAAAMPAPDAGAVERCSRIFRALGEAGRLRLLTRLAQGPLCVGELAAAEGESVTIISQRLRVLRADNIVRRTREGKHVLYALADDHMLHLVNNGLAHAAEPMNTL